jgi:hypothetical protein
VRAGSRRKGFGAGLALLCLLSLLGPACASSVLVAPHDATFERAVARLQRTTTIVQALAPPAEESSLFLQAESVYQYRFGSARRGGLAYVSEAAAAVTDFPAFQAFAGSVDLTELRTRGSDAAAQLWETLLARHPGTALRPLTLYRLGWAYRNVGVSGLPRASGNEAFEALAAEAPGARLAALGREAESVPAKSKGAAAAWSLVPGLGQFYVGEKRGGTLRLGIAVSALAAIAIPVYVAFGRREDLTWRHDWPLLATSVAGLVVLSIDYTSSYEDAMHRVVIWNEGAEAAFQDAHPEAP